MRFRGSQYKDLNKYMRKNPEARFEIQVYPTDIALLDFDHFATKKALPRVKFASDKKTVKKVNGLNYVYEYAADNKVFKKVYSRADYANGSGKIKYLPMKLVTESSTKSGYTVKPDSYDAVNKTLTLVGVRGYKGEVTIKVRA